MEITKYVFNNGIEVEGRFADKLYKLKKLHPEKPDIEDRHYDRSDYGMANLFAVLYADETRYCAEHKKWYTYEYGVWKKDEGAILVHNKLQEFAQLMSLYCMSISDGDVKSDYLKFVVSMGNRNIRERILKDATCELRIEAKDFDANPYLINCINGTYNLKKGTFYEHKWDDFLTKQTRFNHTVSRDVRCERWEQFIDEITEGEKDKADFLQRALGYSLLGNSNEECMFILHGKTTRNGKSTLLNTVERMMGDYSSVVPVGIICKGDKRKDAESATPSVAGLKGKRFVTMSESSAYGKLDEENIKRYTGGEDITARGLYESPVTFRPQFTLWLSCNDLPAVTDKSLFASERLKVIEFNRHFTRDERDIKLKDTFQEEEAMKGIFMWLVRGYKKYVKRGLQMSERMLAVMDSYAKDNDLVLQFLEARCERNEDATIRAKDLYSAFKLWAKSEGMYLISARKFNAEMERHPEWYGKKITISGYPKFTNIRLKEVL